MSDSALGPIGPYRPVSLLGRGAMGAVFRAEHVESGALVALKLAAGVLEDNRSALRREIQAISQIRHPGIVRILDQGIQAGVPWFAMELIEGETLRERLKEMRAHSTDEGCPSRLNALLDVFVKICRSLAHLHGLGLVHGDLKPENVRMKDEAAPVLVDFGLHAAFARSGAGEVLDVASVAGTPEYMSPERVRGELVDARADLYAVGCMLYEAIAGKPPFVGRDARDILRQHLDAGPRRLSEIVNGLPSWIDDLVVELLRKKRRERLGYADVIAARISAGIGSVPESPAAKPYLYRPEFVGRTEPLAELESRIARARDGRGGVIFVGGESGIGKTRLAMEAAGAAASLGMRVVLGRCPSAEDGRFGGSLIPFRPLLSAIADYCARGGRERTEEVLGSRGPILSPYEPTLADAPGQSDHPPAPPISPEAAPERLRRAMLDTVIALARVGGPVVLVIDDVHWADELSRAVLGGFDGETLSELPVLVICNFRSDEVDEGILSLIERPGMTRLKLDRLGLSGIRRLVADMLGLSEQPTTFVGQLFRDTEGNPFFVSEYLHAAVDEGLLALRASGHWEIRLDEARGEGATPLPRSLHQLLSLRMSRLSAECRRVTEAASVLREDFDEALLQKCADMAEQELIGHIRELMRREILVRHVDGSLRFGHGKIAEVAYEAIPRSDRPRWHERAARALEAACADPSSVSRILGSLAQHWAYAANVANPEPEVVAHALGVLERAADQALGRYANDEALKFFETVLRLEAALPSSIRAERKGRWERQLSEAYFRVGRPLDAREHLLRAVRLLGAPVPETRIALSAAVAGEAARQVYRRLVGARGAREATAEGRARELEIAAAHAQLGLVSFIAMEESVSLLANLRALNRAERAGPSPELVNGHAMIGLTAGVLFGPRIADVYFREGCRVARAVAGGYSLGRILYTEGFYRLGLADWAPCTRALAEACEVFRAIGDLRWRDTALLTTGNTHYLRGDHQGALRLFELARGAATERNDLQVKLWATLSIAIARLTLGDVAKALELVDEIEAALGHDLKALGDRANEINVYSLRAAADLALGRTADALENVSSVLGLMESAPPTVNYAVFGYATSADVALRLSAAEPNGRVAELANTAVRRLRRFARFFPIAEPAAARAAAQQCGLKGASAKAQKLWAEAARLAKERDMTHDEAVALQALGSLGTSGRKSRDRARSL